VVVVLSLILILIDTKGPKHDLPDRTDRMIIVIGTLPVLVGAAVRDCIRGYIPHVNILVGGIGLAVAEAETGCVGIPWVELSVRLCRASWRDGQGVGRNEWYDHGDG
jgi:hypothetical protein